jgi:hypothetical protein
MPNFEEIVRYLAGAWRMMTGRRDGLLLLDLSADGFWNSFYAIAVATPPLFVGWVGYADSIAGDTESSMSRVVMLVTLAFIDIAGWIIPLVLLAIAARPAGIADRFAAYVVVSNWGTVITAWMALPAGLLRLLVPDSPDVAVSVGVVIFLVTLVLSWRLTNAAINKGPAIATGVFVAMVMASIATVLFLQSFFGIEPR